MTQGGNGPAGQHPQRHRGAAIGDESRWNELFELNRSGAELQNGRVLSRPERIWPGMRLRLPTAQVIPTHPSGQSQSAPPAVVPNGETSAPAGALSSSSVAKAPVPAMGDAKARQQARRRRGRRRSRRSRHRPRSWATARTRRLPPRSSIQL